MNPNTGIFAGPCDVTVTLTTRCNLACSYCPQVRVEGQRASEATVRAAARLVASSGHPWPRLTLTGGEPLLEPRLISLAASALRASSPPGRRPGLSLFTNGTLLDADRTRLLVDDDIDVTLSFDGPGEAQDARAPGTSARLTGILRRIAARETDWFSRRLGVRITIHSANVGSLASSTAHLLESGMKRIEAVPVVTPDPGWDSRSAFILDGQLAEIVRAARPGSDPGASPFVPFRPTGARGAGHEETCGLGSPESLFFDVDGTVAPCGAMVPSMLREATPLVRSALESLAGARVPDPDLSGALVVRSVRARGLAFARDLARKRSLRGPCSTCEALDECFVCPASIAWAPEQDPDLVPAIQCDWNRLVARHRRAFLARAGARRENGQGAGRSSSAAATSAVTPARIAGA